jgi:D-alanyl-lipoteichoic acid acyltransferase DltB (MBOAT superfamily)
MLIAVHSARSEGKRLNHRVNRNDLTLLDYVRRRNGVPLGARGALTNMLRRSLGARSFAGFWQYWNPIFGYCLGRYVYKPLKTILPAPASLVLTFVACGFVHDLVIMALRQDVAFVFTPWFFYLGIGVVLGKLMNMDLSRFSFGYKAVIHLSYLGACLVLALLVIA